MSDAYPLLSEASGSTSSSLLRRIVARDPDAWDRLANLYGPLVYSWARRQGLQDADAGEVVQEVFLTVHARIDTFRRDRPGDSFRAWLWTITRHKLGDHIRRLAGQPQAAGGSDAQHQFRQLPDALDDGSSEPGGADADRTLLMQRALEMIRPEFSDKNWQAFWRMVIDGQPAADIGKDLGMTDSAVRQAKYRVMQRLHEELDGS